MASFDISKAASIISTSPNPILDSLGTQFGVPRCMMEFSKELLASLPTPALKGIGGGIQEGKALANSVFKDGMRKTWLGSGIVEYDTTTGRFVFVGSSSNKGVEENAEQGLDNMFGLGIILGVGAQAWVIGESLLDQFDDAKKCFDQMNSFDALQKGPSVLADKLVGFESNGNVFPPPPAAVIASQEFEDNRESMEIAARFVVDADAQLQAIAEIRQCRLESPETCPEPCFWANMPNPDFDPNLPSGPDNPATLEEMLGGRTTLCLLDAEAGPDGFPILTASSDHQEIITASGTQPPLSIKGQYLFSRTGIYYDSYGGGLEYDGCITNIVKAVYYDDEGNPIAGTGVPQQALKYMFDHNPNIGGKGEQVSWATFNQWANTAFDIDVVDESPSMQAFYDDDHFLQVLVNQRNREIYDTSNYIGELVTDGYAADSAVLTNQRQILLSKISSHDVKIKKRKKQIQVHVILSPTDSPAVQGEIPINNFQSLDGGLLAIEREKQQNLIFRTGEVSGVVLPLCPEFIKSSVPQDAFTVEDLMVAPVGVGQIITSDFPFDGVSGTILSLTDEVHTDNLVAIYNFLDSDIVSPDSDEYLSINCNTSAASHMATQLVASSIPNMFPSGIGVPYFRGVCSFFSGTDGNPKATSYASNDRYLYSAHKPYGYGRISSGHSDIDSLLYNNVGASFDFWTHIPDLGTANGLGWAGDQSLSSLHRVVMGCENRGGTNSTDIDDWTVGPAQHSVRGLLMGFSRDRRITKGLAPSNQPSDNNLTEGLVFHMSPTQSMNTSGVTFIAVSGDPAACLHDEVAGSGHYGIAVDTSAVTASRYSFDDCSTVFVHTTVSIDYGGNLVSIYLNGELLKSQTVLETFGTAGPPQIPSMTDTSSFSYDPVYKGELPANAPLFPPNSLGYRDFWNWAGPIPEGSSQNMSLTPWIIGGGYTDGMHPDDILNDDDAKTTSNTGMNFMGGKWGGKKSGLHGFIGSLKLYNKALSSGDALKNYNAQKGFFTTIRTYDY